MKFTDHISTIEQWVAALEDFQQHAFWYMVGSAVLMLIWLWGPPAFMYSVMGMILFINLLFSIGWFVTHKMMKRTERFAWFYRVLHAMTGKECYSIYLPKDGDNREQTKPIERSGFSGQPGQRGEILVEGSEIPALLKEQQQ